MTLIQRISDLITAIKTETRSIRTLISGTDSGDTSALATTSTNVVGAINEVRTLAQQVATAGATVDDTVINSTNVWSSNRTNSEIISQIAASLEGEDISDLAAQVAANAAADNSLVSFGSAQTLTAAQITQVGNNIGIGEPDTDLVAIWNAA